MLLKRKREGEYSPAYIINININSNINIPDCNSSDEEYFQMENLHKGALDVENLSMPPVNSSLNQKRWGN